MFGNWARKSSSSVSDVGVTVLGLDVNSTRARAIGQRENRWRTVMLDEPFEELPFAISLDKRAPEVGRQAIQISRRFPHLVCLNYLPCLGMAKEWKAGRLRLDPFQALALTMDRIRASLGEYDTLALTLPSYLSPAQVTKFLQLADKAKWNVKGAAILPLVLAAEYAHEWQNVVPLPMNLPKTIDPNKTWCETEDESDWVVPMPQKGHEPDAPFAVLIIDADEHAMTASVVQLDPTQARLLSTIPLPRLSVRVWKERLLDALSDRCIRLCRRDPRDSAVAEQALYEQLDDALERTRHGQKVDLTVRSEHWFQNLVQQPDDFDGFCTGLMKQSLDSIRELVVSAQLAEPLRAVLFTNAAGRLPGLVEALQKHMPERTTVKVLPPEAVAQATAKLGSRWRDGSLPRVFLDTSLPLAVSPPKTSGSVRQSGIVNDY